MNDRTSQLKVHFNLDDDSNNSSKVILLFNFCPHPLDKTNIIKINIEIIEKFTLKDALYKAIQIFNSQNENKIIDKTEKYKLRISKKSGLPDLDLPSVQESLKLSELNVLNYSVIIEQEHIIILPRKKYDPEMDITGSTVGNKESYISNHKSLNFDLKMSDVNSQKEIMIETTNNKKGCCNTFLNKIFGKKK